MCATCRFYSRENHETVRGHAGQNCGSHIVSLGAAFRLGSLSRFAGIQPCRRHCHCCPIRGGEDPISPTFECWYATTLFGYDIRNQED